MRYKMGLKYQLDKMYITQTPIKGLHVMSNDGFVKLTPSGFLFIKAGFAWDGPSGPMLDSQWVMTPSLVHDALYQLIREGKLSIDTYRSVADQLFYDMCMNRAPRDEDGTVEPWAAALCRAMLTTLREFGEKAATREGGRQIKEVD